MMPSCSAARAGTRGVCDERNILPAYIRPAFLPCRGAALLPSSVAMNAVHRRLLAALFALPVAVLAQMGDSRDAAGSAQPPPPAKWIRPAPILTPEEAL